MTGNPRKADPLEHEIEIGLKPGAFISYGECSSFTSILETTAARIAEAAKTDAVRAVALYEAFLAGCYEKADELDDSSGSFGQFVEGLFCKWITARQAAGAAPEETALRVLAWMEDDPYGFCNYLEKKAIKAFDQAGLAAFEKLVLARLGPTATANDTASGSSRYQPEYFRRRWGEVLRTLYIEQKNVAAYVALAEETGLTSQDCHAVATILVSRRRSEEAMTWVERGIDLDNGTPHGSIPGYNLAHLKRTLLTKLGRNDEALEEAWVEYCEHPTKYSYSDLMKFVPKAERSKWREKALDAAKGTDLGSLIALLLEAKGIERLAELIRRTEDGALERVSHYTTEPAAKKLERSHPDLAARLWRAQGMRIVNAKKSKYYDAALANFERAQHCYEKAGLPEEWENTANRVRSEHHRKTGFMSRFENLKARSGLIDKPSFLERAKARWGSESRRMDEPK